MTYKWHDIGYNKYAYADETGKIIAKVEYGSRTATAYLRQSNIGEYVEISDAKKAIELLIQREINFIQQS